MWQTTAFGAYSISATVVPVYDSLGAEASEYIVNHADIKILFSSEFKFKNALKLLDKCPKVEKLIIFSNKEPEEKHATIPVLTFKEVFELGQSYADKEMHEQEPDDVYLIMYTSGSTVLPKGCVIAAANIVAVAIFAGWLVMFY